MTAGPFVDEADAFKACCADFYGDDLLALVLGPSFHPGGRDLTRRLARLGCLRPGERALDVASGPGDSALLLAREFEAQVHGVDLSASLVARATKRARADGFGSRVTFSIGDAERLPLADGSVDAILSECALCTFPDKRAVLGEFTRVLAPGGRLLLSDVVVERERLPWELSSVAGRVACLAGALPVAGYLRLLETSGLRVCALEHHDRAVVHMVEEIQARLDVIASAGAGGAVDIPSLQSLIRSAVEAAQIGVVGYVLIAAELDEPLEGRSAA